MEGQVTLFDPDLWSGRTSPEPSPPIKEKTSKPSSKRSSASQSRTLPTFHYIQKRSGLWQTPTTEMGGLLPTEFSTLSFGESPSVAVVSRLSQILEDDPHPKYSLSAAACKGIRRRSDRRGKKLPWLLDLGLLLQSHSGCGQDAPGGGKGPLLQTENIAPTLNCNHEQPIICLTFPEDVANTLLGKSQLSHTEVYDARGNGDGHTVPTLTGDHENRVTDYTAIVLAVDGYNQTVSETTPSLRASRSDGDHAGMVLVAVPREATSFDLAQVTSKTNRSKGSVGVAYSLAKTGQPAVITTTEEGTILVDGQPCVLVKLLVRRLTPLECERLQGYPDGWTVLPPIEDMSEYEYDFWRRFLLEKAEREGKARANEAGTYTIWRKTETKNEDGETVETWEDTGKPYKHKTSEQMVAWYNRSFCKDTDSARYKAMGNSIALPQWKWVLKRLCGCYERDATMASLFDGVGGFPLLWEQLNGKGSCLWASEIEPFPVAVTRYRFGDED